MSERAALRRISALDKARKDRLDNAVRAMLQHPDTREYLWWLLSIGKVTIQPFIHGSPDGTAFQCGELNVGNQIFDHIMEINPEGYLTMYKEQLNERSASNRPRVYSPDDAAPDDSDDASF
jgi:hypothetical protein